MYTYIIPTLFTKSSNTPKVMSSFISQSLLPKYHSPVKGTRSLEKQWITGLGPRKYKMNLKHIIVSKSKKKKSSKNERDMKSTQETSLKGLSLTKSGILSTLK